MDLNSLAWYRQITGLLIILYHLSLRSVSLCLCLSVSLSLSVCLSVCLSVSLSLSLSLSLSSLSISPFSLSRLCHFLSLSLSRLCHFLYLHLSLSHFYLSSIHQQLSSCLLTFLYLYYRTSCVKKNKTATLTPSEKLGLEGRHVDKLTYRPLSVLKLLSLSHYFTDPTHITKKLPSKEIRPGPAINNLKRDLGDTENKEH